MVKDGGFCRVLEVGNRQISEYQVKPGGYCVVVSSEPSVLGVSGSGSQIN